MNFLKKLWGSKENPSTTVKFDPNKDSTIIKNVTTFNGLDNAFLDLIYFSNDLEKRLLVEKINNVIKTLNITNETLRTEFMNTFPLYIHDNGIELPFIAELFTFKSIIVSVSMPSGIVKNITDTTPEYSGSEKLNYYHTAMNLVSHNLESKIKNNFTDISFEENIVLKNLTDDNKDFHMINILYQLGNSFMLINKQDKMSNYYGLIYNSLFDLSPNTIADYIRYAGEDYYKIGDLENALKFLKKGLELNSKLGVKRLIAEIENKLT
jgi:tetratricopeptide (TPR) repeat protein